MGAKTKIPQKENLEQAHGRDLFQTPDYATDIIVPFLKGAGIKRVWECAAGFGKITRRLTHHGFTVIASDISYSDDGGYFNFLTDHMVLEGNDWATVTNPPFSLKRKFYLRCLQYKIPFALLIPADYSGWIVEAMQNGAEKIIPTRRIDYITPNVLRRIHEGEVWECIIQPAYQEYKTMKDFTMDKMSLFEAFMDKYKTFMNYNSIYEVPKRLLRKYSSSDFHSMWLTMGLNIGKQETYVELSNKEKDNI